MVSTSKSIRNTNFVHGQIASQMVPHEARTDDTKKKLHFTSHQIGEVI